MNNGMLFDKLSSYSTRISSGAGRRVTVFSCVSEFVNANIAGLIIEPGEHDYINTMGGGSPVNFAYAIDVNDG